MDVAAHQRESVILTEEAHRTPRPEFDRIYRAERGVVQRHLRYLTGNAQVAEDLTQETFAQLYARDMPVGQSDLRNPRAWLLTVASNLAYNHFRTEARRVAREASTAPADRIAAADLDQALDVRAALGSLDARDRMVLMLRGSGFSYAEIADAVNLAPGSVGTTLARAQRRFREAYEGAEHDAQEKE
jgi:RNA polymerase sigma-70 factor (ECF subfamily)